MADETWRRYHSGKYGNEEVRPITGNTEMDAAITAGQKTLEENLKGEAVEKTIKLRDKTHKALEEMEY